MPPRRILVPSGALARLTAGITDLQRGLTGLSALVQTALAGDPFGGHVLVFQGRRGDLIKVLWWDGDGVCLFAQRLERGNFVWPWAENGIVALTRVQLSMLHEGIDWRRPVRTTPPQAEKKATPARRPLPENLPRETKRREPKQNAFPDCGGALRLLGEDGAEVLESLPDSFNVIQEVGPEMSCDCCSRIAQEPASSRAVDPGVAGPGLLAYVLVSKYASHLSLYHQAEIFSRLGVDLPRSTLADWGSGASRTLAPLVEAIRKYVLAVEKLHGRDTPVTVLAPGNGKTHTGQ